MSKSTSLLTTKRPPHEYCGAKHPDFWTKATYHCNERRGHAGDHQCIIHYDGRVNEKWENASVSDPVVEILIK
jgi:hypothetical protein